MVGRMGGGEMLSGRTCVYIVAHWCKMFVSPNDFGMYLRCWLFTTSRDSERGIGGG